MTTLITGGTSSIGRVLVKQMAAQGEEVRVLVRPHSNRQGLELPGVSLWKEYQAQLPHPVV